MASNTPLTLYAIFATMRDWFQGATRKASDFTRGSVIRTLMEAISAPLEELYYRLYIVLPRKYFLAKATDDADVDQLVADHTFNMVRRKDATTAGGMVIVYGYAGATVPASFQLVGLDNNVIYSTTRDAQIPANSVGLVQVPLQDASADMEAIGYVKIPVIAMAAGAVGNLSPGRLLSPQSALNNAVEFQVADEGIGGGADRESNESVKARVPEFFQNITTGTPDAIEAEARNVEGVRNALYRGGYPAPGWWTCFVDGGGGAPQELLDRVYQALARHVDADTLYAVAAAQTMYADLKITLRTRPVAPGTWATIKQAAERAVVNAMLGLTYGQDFYDTAGEAVITGLQDPNILSNDVDITAYRVNGITRTKASGEALVANGGNLEVYPNQQERLRIYDPGSMIRAGNLEIVQEVINE